MADMRTVVIVGNRDTRRVGNYVYTPATRLRVKRQDATARP